MSERDSKSDGGRSRSVQRVAEWRAQVAAYFRDDWSRLRSLILQLQEEGWEQPRRERGSIHFGINAVSETSESAESGSLSATFVACPPSEQSADDSQRTTEADAAHDRLAELARCIDRRLSTISARRS